MGYYIFVEYESGFNMLKSSSFVYESGSSFLMVFIIFSLELMLVVFCFLFSSCFFVLLGFSFLFLKFVLEVYEFMNYGI